MRRGSFAWAALLALVASGAWAAAGDQLVVTGDGVNVRSEPTTSGSIRLRVYRDQEVTELAREGEWVRVEIGGQGDREGWIHGSLLAPADGAPSSATAATPAEAPEPAAEPTPESVAGQVRELEREVERELVTTDQAPATADQPAPASQEATLRPEPPANAIEPAAGPVAVLGPEVARFKESVDYLNSRAVQVAGVDLFTEVEPVDDATVRVGATEAWSTVPPAGQRSYLNTLLDRWAAAKGGEGPVSVQIADPTGEVVAERTGP